MAFASQWSQLFWELQTALMEAGFDDPGLLETNSDLLPAELRALLDSLMGFEADEATHQAFGSLL